MNSKSNPSVEEKEFLADYLATTLKIGSDKAKMGDGLTGIGRELITLPESSATTIKLPELVIKPEIFNGVKPKPRKWIQEFNESIVANGWLDSIAIKYLPTFLSFSAKDWCFTEVKPFLRPDTKWYQIHNRLFENYLGEGDYEQLSKAVESARQYPDESISNFVPRLRPLILLLTPNLPEVDQLRQLKSKLRPEYKQSVALANSKTIKEFRNVCLKIEAGFPERKT